MQQRPPDATGLVGVERAKSGSAHCAWCDTLIGLGTPRLIVRWHHGAGGAFLRDNGAASGVCAGGVCAEYMHPQCAWQLDTNIGGKGRPAACNLCGQPTEPGTRMKCQVGSAAARCTPSNTAPWYFCFGCTAAFVEQHRPLLAGFVGAEQRQQPIAWVKARGLFQPRDQVGGPQPWTKQVLGIFRATGPEADRDEAEAVRRHHELQRMIHGKLRRDKELHRASSEGRPSNGGGVDSNGVS